MGTILTADVWLAGLETIAVLDAASVSLVREEVRRCAGVAGLGRADAEEVVAAASELAHNQLAHAAGGRVAVRQVTRAGVGGIEVIAADRGDGIADPAAALSGKQRGAGSLGVGLAAAARLTAEMDIEVRRGEGTCVRVRRFAAPVARSEVAVLSRASRGEVVCGDDALCLRDGDDQLLVIADGLGHGSLAREASAAAVAATRTGRAPVDLLADWDVALRGTRGAVGAALCLPAGDGELRFAGAGNIAGMLYQDTGVRRFAGVPRVLGSARPGGKRFAEERLRVEERRTVVLCTDGITSRADLSDEPDVLRQPPIVVAQRLVERFGRADDDVLVVVAR